jgi:hypothetical protein
MINNKTNSTGLLTKQQYLQLNAIAFRDLNKADKDIKYQLYKQKYLRKNQSTDNKNKQLITRNDVKFRSINNNNNNKVKPIPRNMNNLQNLSVNSMKFKLSKCLLSYARASIDPFDNITELPCIPDTIVVPSYKHRAYIEADVVVGTQGVGFAVMNPWKMIMSENSNTTTSSDWPVVTTSAAYNDVTYTWTPVQLGTEVFGWNPQTIIRFADLITQNFSWRLVAAGMELDYTGVLLDQAGLVTVIQWAGLGDIPSGLTPGDIRQNPRSQTCATSREARCYIRYEPTDAENFSYKNEPYYYPPGRTVNYPLGIFVSGATPNTTFRVRGVAFFEIQNSNLPASPSESDPVGFPALQAARSSLLPTPDPQQDLFTILKRTAGNILNSISGFAPTIGTAIGSIFGQPAAGAAIGSVSKDLIQSIFG